MIFIDCEALSNILAIQERKSVFLFISMHIFHAFLKCFMHVHVCIKMKIDVQDLIVVLTFFYSVGSDNITNIKLP